MPYVNAVVHLPAPSTRWVAAGEDNSAGPVVATSDDGMTWTTSGPVGNVGVGALLVTSQGKLLAATGSFASFLTQDGAVYTSSDGVTWTKGAAFQGFHPTALALDPTQPGKVWLGTTQGVYAGDESGAAFAPVDLLGTTVSSVLAMSDPTMTNPELVIAGTGDYGDSLIGNGTDAFMTSFSPDLATRVYGTYAGGAGKDVYRAVADPVFTVIPLMVTASTNIPGSGQSSQTKQQPAAGTLTVPLDVQHDLVTAYLAEIAPSADLAISVTAQPCPATIGKPVTLTVIVTNNGPSAAAKPYFSVAVDPVGIKLTDFQDQQVVSVPSDWNCSFAHLGSMHCFAQGDLPAPNPSPYKATFQFSFDADPHSKMLARIRSDKTPDPLDSNNEFKFDLLNAKSCSSSASSSSTAASSGTNTSTGASTTTSGTGASTTTNGAGAATTTGTDTSGTTSGSGGSSGGGTGCAIVSRSTRTDSRELALFALLGLGALGRRRAAHGRRARSASIP
jgi:hypothetical protein